MMSHPDGPPAGTADPYQSSWEGYWSALPPRPHEAIWDSHPEVTAARHLSHFERYFDAELPVFDLGCGSGTQTGYLAERYHRVLGFDFSETALAVARAQTATRPVEFRHLDLRDEAAAGRLHGEFGDANLYLRGIFHQTPREHRPKVAAAVAILLGRRGHMFDVEMSPASGPIMKTLMAETPPPKLATVFEHGLTPAAWTEGMLDECITGAGLRIVDTGDIPLHTTERLEDGSPLELPMIYIVAASDPPSG